MGICDDAERVGELALRLLQQGEVVRELHVRSPSRAARPGPPPP
jgi:hypothetical protein